jgi:uncharacterized membrane protein YfcA
VELHIIVGLLLSAVIGLSLGLIGAGGSIITVPLLVYVMRVPPHEAVGMSLAVVGSTALVGAWMHHRRGGVRGRVALLFAVGGVLGALAGSRLTYLVSPATLLLIFAALMFIVAGLMLRRSAVEDAAAPASVARSLAAGLGVGVLTGFLGVGGGFLIVPAMALFGGLTMRQAVGTSLAVIALNSAAGFVAHLGRSEFDLPLTAMVAGMAMLGAIAGTTFSLRLPALALRRGFAWFVLAVALFLIVRNLPL